MDTTQTTLDDAIAARDEAMERVDQHADPDWKEQAKAALWALIQASPSGYEFITDDVEWPGARENRARGPIMLAAARAGYIESTGRVRKSAQRQCHANPRTIWRVV